MKLKISYQNFWSDFDDQGLLERSFIQVLREDGYEFVIDKKNPDIIFFNSFGGPITYNGPAIKIGYVTEDMNRFKEIFKKIHEGYFDFVLGNIPTMKSSKFCKHPLYVAAENYNNPSKEIMDKINNKVKAKDINKLKFCSLIASHDMYGNRMPVVKLLSDLGFVECPGKFNHNVKSFDDEGLTKVEYLENFLFTICPENHKGHDGYTSEKLNQAIESGCIPIYFGHTNDEEDCKVFNQNRIIRYDPSSKESMKECHKKVKELMGNKDLLREYYQQPPYLENGREVIDNMFKDLKKKFKKLLKKKGLI